MMEQLPELNEAQGWVIGIIIIIFIIFASYVLNKFIQREDEEKHKHKHKNHKKHENT